MESFRVRQILYCFRSLNGEKYYLTTIQFMIYNFLIKTLQMKGQRVFIQSINDGQGVFNGKPDNTLNIESLFKKVQLFKEMKFPSWEQEINRKPNTPEIKVIEDNNNPRWWLKRYTIILGNFCRSKYQQLFVRRESYIQNNKPNSSQDINLCDIQPQNINKGHDQMNRLNISVIKKQLRKLKKQYTFVTFLKYAYLAQIMVRFGQVSRYQIENLFIEGLNKQPNQKIAKCYYLRIKKCLWYMRMKKYGLCASELLSQKNHTVEYKVQEVKSQFLRFKSSILSFHQMNE